MRESVNGQVVSSWRLRLTLVVMAGLSLLFVGKLFSLQILQGEAYLAEADENRFSRISLPAPRGIIYDANGSQLVRNIPAFNVNITPALLSDSEAEKESIFLLLSQLTGVPLDLEGPAAAPCVPGRGILQLVEEGETNRPFDSWPIACDVDASLARILRQRQIDMPGVSVDAVPVRDYTTNDLTSAIIGYLGAIPAEDVAYWQDLGFVPERDRVGYAGIEFQYQDILAGLNGLRLVERDVAGAVLREVGAGNPVIPGDSLRLTLDTRLQAIARTALLNRMEFLDRFAGEKRTSIGVVIAMNPQTGEILAMVSWPTYENQLFAQGLDIETVIAALRLAALRRHQRPASAPALEPIRSLHYFVPVIKELQRKQADTTYLAYVNRRYEDVFQRPPSSQQENGCQRPIHQLHAVSGRR